ncbi:GNAT family N-acetyltransferase [Amnibacterium sp. CER49]|uniref:GNAT family N-acetyltransferase n=1 Tax=Amnibacterium sp. CER49 TaxID=3039161 RepID=UPI002448C7F5|nr:GNAT family N-acetyltransferase [Amnibacterium sp. CER49]MDH2442854.1 GNAT family N-acetyltransferase [Amnibacterium sp. CER49]
MSTHASDQYESLLMRLPKLTALPPLPAHVAVAGPTDAADLATLLDVAFEEHWDEERVRRELFDDATVRCTFVIRDGDRIVATASERYVDGYDGAGYLHWVASHPDARGRGHGVAATVAVLHAFLAQGVSASVLETDDERLAAIAVYLRLGYVPVYRSPQHELRWSAIFTALGARRQPPSPRPDGNGVSHAARSAG